MAELDLDPETIEVREVNSQDEAEEIAFPGSPTIRVDGRDVSGTEPDLPAGLACRVYLRRDGRVSPLPDPLDVRDALTRAAPEPPAG
jgi:hypothetical protein